MNIFLIDDLFTKEFNAAYKAKIDVNNILLNRIENSEIFHFYRYKLSKFGLSNKLIRYINLRIFFRLNQLNYPRFLRKVREGDVIVVPFPFEIQWFVLLTSFVYKSLAKLKNTRDVKIVFVIHDVVSLRFPELNSEAVELPLFDIANVVIVHNPIMMDWLISKGVPAEKLINLEVFDYLSTDPKSLIDLNSPGIIQQRRVIYAGNLLPWKAEYLYKWKPTFDVDLYGVGVEEKKLSQNFHYRGIFDPDKPVIDVSGISFGLVWDGPAIEELIGPGAYLRYNNPHKVSLYLSQELPVIVSSEAALAPFVLDNKLGIAVDRLQDIDDIINNMSIEEYTLIKNNVKNVGKKLRNGEFMYTALKKAIELVK